MVGFHLPGELIGPGCAGQRRPPLRGRGTDHGQRVRGTVRQLVACRLAATEPAAAVAARDRAERRSRPGPHGHARPAPGERAHRVVPAWLGERCHQVGKSGTDIRLPMSREDIARLPRPRAGDREPRFQAGCRTTASSPSSGAACRSSTAANWRRLAHGGRYHRRCTRAGLNVRASAPANGNPTRPARHAARHLHQPRRRQRQHARGQHQCTRGACAAGTLQALPDARAGPCQRQHHRQRPQAECGHRQRRHCSARLQPRRHQQRGTQAAGHPAPQQAQRDALARSNRRAAGVAAEGAIAATEPAGATGHEPPAAIEQAQRDHDQHRAGERAQAEREPSLRAMPTMPPPIPPAIAPATT